MYRIQAEALAKAASAVVNKEQQQRMNEIKRAAEIRIGELTRELEKAAGAIAAVGQTYRCM